MNTLRSSTLSASDRGDESVEVDIPVCCRRPFDSGDRDGGTQTQTWAPTLRALSTFDPSGPNFELAFSSAAETA